MNRAFIIHVVQGFRQHWLAFGAQPGNTHMALAAGLLLSLLVVLLATGNEAAPQSTQPPTTAAVPESGAAPGTSVGLMSDSGSGPESAPFSEPAAITDGNTATVPVPSIEALPEPGAATALAPLVPATARLVIILDDIGYNAAMGERAVALPGAITYAVLPYTPHGKRLAEMAHQANKEVMLHAPMSNLAGTDTGPGGLDLTLAEDEFVHILRGAIADIPHVVGVNNHTGSELTAAEQPMRWVMQELKQQGLYFVDSMTTGVSVAEKTARALSVPALKRHVFLDNEATVEAVHQQFLRALTIAREQGFAVAIGHPYPATLEYLEYALATLPEQGIELVPVSALLPAVTAQPSSQPSLKAPLQPALLPSLQPSL